MKTRNFWTMTSLGALFIAATLTSGVFLLRNKSLTKSLDQEKIRSESLLSEKLDLEKTITVFKKDLTSLKGKNDKLDETLKNTNGILLEKESQVRKLLKQNASLVELKTKHAELEALRAKLELEVASLHRDLDKTKSDNQNLIAQTEGYRKEMGRIVNQNNMLKSMLTDNYRIEALRGRNEKLTVAARRTNHLMVSFDLPEGTSEKLHFQLVTPGGQKISSREDMSASIDRTTPDPLLMASLSGSATNKRDISSRVEFSYKPNQKLVPGIYSFQIFDGEEYLGSAQLRLK